MPWIPLRCSRGLTSVPADIPPFSTSVYLNGSRITNLTSGVFSHLTVCAKLDLSNNQISVIESGAFTGLRALKELNLRNNSISGLGPNTFSPLLNLETLDLKEAGLVEHFKDRIMFKLSSFKTTI